MTTAVCAVLTRNSASLLPDWLSWHSALGFDRLLVIDASSTDATQTIAQAAGTLLPVDLHILPPASSRDALTTAAISAAGHQQDWLLILDADEFLDPATTLEALLNTASNAIPLNWCIYGKPTRQSPSPFRASPLRSTESFPDNHLTRTLHRTSSLQNTSLPPENPTPTNWASGRILHYVWSADPHMPPHLADHYICQNEQDLSPLRRDPQTRSIKTALQNTLLQAGETRLRALLTQNPALTLPPEPGPSLPDVEQFDTFTLTRIRPSLEERLLLTPQTAPFLSRTHTCLLHNPAGEPLTQGPDGSLTLHPNGPSTPIISAYTESHPTLMVLLNETGTPLTLPDIALPHPVLTLPRLTPDTVLLPACGSLPALTLSLTPLPSNMTLNPLPEQDTPDGLSFHGFCAWLYTHPDTHALDITRTLLTLSPEHRHHLTQLIPEWAAFF